MYPLQHRLDRRELEIAWAVVTVHYLQPPQLLLAKRLIQGTAVTAYPPRGLSVEKPRLDPPHLTSLLLLRDHVVRL